MILFFMFFLSVILLILVFQSVLIFYASFLNSDLEARTLSSFSVAKYESDKLTTSIIYINIIEGGLCMKCLSVYLYKYKYSYVGAGANTQT